MPQLDAGDKDNHPHWGFINLIYTVKKRKERKKMQIYKKDLKASESYIFIEFYLYDVEKKVVTL